MRHSGNNLYTYLRDGISFSSREAAGLKTIYFPLCGVDSTGVKSAITPSLSGDIKIDSLRYLTKPVSTEDLRNNLRDFFCHVEGKGVFSLAQASTPDDSAVEAGPLWHKLTRRHPKAGLLLEAVNFVPVTGENVELMRVTVKNVSQKVIKITPTFSLPIFARALANKHDHEQVTSLLNRIVQLPEGVVVEPTMIFNEHGHKVNQTAYSVLGRTDKGEDPVGTFPTARSFYGEGGTCFAPAAVMKNAAPVDLPKEALDGQEAAGALRFKKVTLGSGRKKEYFIVMGIGSGRGEAKKILERFASTKGFKSAFARNQNFWAKKADTIRLRTADAQFNAWMHWVSLQPVLRRIFGCSFLPDHDYGKGGKGWRDLWQDLLSLILIEPGSVRAALINNFAGVRVDGSNATIIGAAPGEFLADRDAISRVWMDHGAWPFLTLLLYIHQTGDANILFERQSYFCDPQTLRGQRYDRAWTPQEGSRSKDFNDRVYEGSILEHVLIQHLVQFFNVGEHNITRLENADWNDGLDMAAQRGESVAFMSLYAGNLLDCADLLEHVAARQGIREVPLARELLVLCDLASGTGIDYADPQAKRKLLFEKYFPSVQPRLSGEQVNVKAADLARDLRRKGKWIFGHIKAREKIRAGRQVLPRREPLAFADRPPSGGNNPGDQGWFNGYYDNQGRMVEGKEGANIRMTLTGQVFPLMSGLADDKEIEAVVDSVRRYLKDKKLGGYRLNTDFGVPHYLDLGRAFGFAYGTKENGSFFSHMTVMYACALYKRGFAGQGREVIQSIFRMCVDTQKSKIYPGIPEYFDSQGRGRYHYLTGSASWLVLTMLTQVFGVRGEYGDLIIAPQLSAEEFDPKGLAGVTCPFAGKTVTITYINKRRLDSGSYAVKTVTCQGKPIACDTLSASRIRIPRKFFHQSSNVELTLQLG
ncbi:MAG: cellobiose phosphorylase [Candidatus Omnitrophica bacterium]|nr:cellobiose phosphorylase [Candidatus Omnitrophota bacterium]